jgi:carbon monoxide dehydrogenase subunit G
MKAKLLIVFLGIAVAFFPSCRKFFIEGNGLVTEEERALASFDKVANEGNFEVEIINDTLFYVVVRAESNLLRYIRTHIQDGALIVDSDETINNTRPMRVEVHMPDLKALEMNGSGSIRFQQFQTENFSAVINGSGNIYGAGIFSETRLKNSGSGNMEFNFQSVTMEAIVNGSGNIQIDGEGQVVNTQLEGSGNIEMLNYYTLNSVSVIKGSGNIYINCRDYLDADIYGSGSVFYLGNPAIVSTIMGSGNVRRY